MANLISYIKTFALAAVAVAGFSACQDDVDDPSANAPVSELQPNTTLLELKEKFWSDDKNYADSILDKDDPSRRFIIHGTVVSSDEEGNIFKSLIIQDETAAMAFSIDSYNLYLRYRRGQEIVLDVTGMEIGKYASLQQIGRKSWYENGKSWQVSFMAPETFYARAELNGYPDLAKIDTLTMSTFSDIQQQTPDCLRKMQSRLVRFRNVYFQDGGKRKLSVWHTKENEEQNTTIIDRNGANLTVRTSGYSTFFNTTLPVGNIDIVGILSYYNDSWQLMLLDGDGIIRVGNLPGTKEKPYSVERAIEDITAGVTDEAWVKGYIVGTLAPEVEDAVDSDDDIQFVPPFVISTSLVIAPSADCTDYSKCIIVPVAMDSPLQQYGNLVNNAGNLGKEILIKGKLGKYLGTWGLTGNTGKADSFEIEGVTVDDGSIADGDGSEEKPYNCAQIVAMNPQSTEAAVESAVWVKGYIVGSMPTGGSSTVLSGTNFSTADAAATNLVIGPTPDCTDYTKCVGVQLPSSMRAALALANKPDNLGKKLAVKGDIMKYCGGPGVKNLTANKLGEGGDTPGPTPGVQPSGEGTQASPYNVAKALELTKALDSSAKITGAYVKGRIASVKEISTQFGNATYYIEDAEGGETFGVFRGSWLNGDKFTSADQLKVGVEVVVYGDMVNYMGNTPQLAQGNKLVSYDGNTGGDTPVDPTPAGDGTEANPYTATQALTLASALDASGKIENVYVKGTVESIKEVSTQFGNATYSISDGTSTFSIFRGYWLNGDKFTSADQLKTGAEVVVNGTIVNYMGNTPQMTTGSKIVSYKDNGGGDTPTPPVVEPGEAVTITPSALTLPGSTTVDGYTIDVEKMSGATAPALNNGVLRAYADNQLTVSGSGKIAKIVFEIASTNKFRYTTFTPDNGTLNPAQASGDTSITWVGDSSSVTFTVGHDATLGSDGAAKRGQIHISKILIYPAK